MTKSANSVSRASDFIQFIGVNTHMSYADTAYRDVAATLDKLTYLGIDSVRDSAAIKYSIAPLTTLGQAGIKLDLMVEGQYSDPLDTQFETLKALAPYVATIEGPNEVNYWEVTYNGSTGVNAAIQQQAYIRQRLDSIASL